MSGLTDRTYKTIGEVVNLLKEEFTDLSISKARYLEDEGLIKPQRTKGGYRKFFQKDIDRLELILKLQRDKYMPLDAIKKKLDALDKGKTVLDEAILGVPESQEILLGEKKEPLLMSEAVKTIGLSVGELQNLESLGLIEPVEAPEGRMVSVEDFEIMRIAKEFLRYGIEPRHLRLYENFTEREVSFLRQVLLPLMKQKGYAGSEKADKVLFVLLKLGEDLKRVLLKKALREYF